LKVAMRAPQSGATSCPDRRLNPSALNLFGRG
jgi:hypothetical protein